MEANYRDMLNSKGLSVNDKQLIQDAYREKFGREMRLKNSKCRDCYNDALIELINKQNKGSKIVMLFGQPFKLEIT